MSSTCTILVHVKITPINFWWWSLDFYQCLWVCCLMQSIFHDYIQIIWNSRDGHTVFLNFLDNYQFSQLNPRACFYVCCNSFYCVCWVKCSKALLKFLDNIQFYQLIIRAWSGICLYSYHYRCNQIFRVYESIFLIKYLVLYVSAHWLS